jgi:hypothetical protein
MATDAEFRGSPVAGRAAGFLSERWRGYNLILFHEGWDFWAIGGRFAGMYGSAARIVA